MEFYVHQYLNMMKIVLFIYSFFCFYSCVLFIKDMKNKKKFCLKKQNIFIALLVLFYTTLGSFCSSLFLFLFLSSLLPVGFLILIPYLEKKTQERLIFTLTELLVPVKAQMKLGVCFMEAWDESVQDLKKGSNKTFILKISEILRFQKNFWHSCADLRFFVQHLLEIRKSSQALDRLLELQNKLKIEQEFLRKTSQTLLHLRWQSFILSGVYFCILGFTLTYYPFYPKLMMTSLICFLTGLYWLAKIGRKMKWSL